MARKVQAFQGIKNNGNLNKSMGSTISLKIWLTRGPEMGFVYDVKRKFVVDP